MEHERLCLAVCCKSLTSAVEALSQFEFDDASGMTRFSRFVERYFGPEFIAPMHLDEPAGARRPRAATPAQHLYKYFRSAWHTAFVSNGRLAASEDGAPEYYLKLRKATLAKALGVVPRN